MQPAARPVRGPTQIQPGFVPASHRHATAAGGRGTPPRATLGRSRGYKTSDPFAADRPPNQEGRRSTHPSAGRSSSSSAASGSNRRLRCICNRGASPTTAAPAASPDPASPSREPEQTHSLKSLTTPSSKQPARNPALDIPSLCSLSSSSASSPVKTTKQPSYEAGEEKMDTITVVENVFGEVERKVQKSYWEEHSKDLTVESMMLDSRAKDLDKEERPEVLGILPSYEGKTVLELGAGIGRFTGELAKEAGHVIALDFIDSVIKRNEEINGHIHNNITFMCADVTSPELKIEDNSIDIVFSNWLLMYLNDEEVEKLIGRIVKWLKPGGHIFIRESCFHQSGDSKRKVNPTHYREPRFYTKVFKECHSYDQEGNSFELSLVTSKCIGAYVKSKKNQNQICWLWEKVKCTEDKGFQRFLDNVQYKSTGILRYERVFGEGYVSTGGFETTKEFVDKLDLKAGQKVLDVGCGIGGGDFYMAETYDVHVLGIDLSINMVSFAIERAIGRSCSVEFEVADCTTKEYAENTFDVIYSRDTILHIQDKPALFRNFFKWLKPGGKVLISDYCRSPGTPSEEFAAYIKQRGYDLHDVKTYGKMLEDAGFHDVIAEDRTDQFLRVLERELGETEKNKEAFLADFTQEDYDDIVNGWSAKLKRSSAGEQKWGLFIATK